MSCWNVIIIKFNLYFFTYRCVNSLLPIYFIAIDTSVTSCSCIGCLIFYKIGYAIKRFTLDTFCFFLLYTFFLFLFLTYTCHFIGFALFLCLYCSFTHTINSSYLPPMCKCCLCLFNNRSTFFFCCNLLGNTATTLCFGLFSLFYTSFQIRHHIIGNSLCHTRVTFRLLYNSIPCCFGFCLLIKRLTRFVFRNTLQSCWLLLWGFLFYRLLSLFLLLRLLNCCIFCNGFRRFCNSVKFFCTKQIYFLTINGLLCVDFKLTIFILRGCYTSTNSISILIRERNLIVYAVSIISIGSWCVLYNLRCCNGCSTCLINLLLYLFFWQQNRLLSSININKHHFRINLSCLFVYCITNYRQRVLRSIFFVYDRIGITLLKLQFAVNLISLLLCKCLTYIICCSLFLLLHINRCIHLEDCRRVCCFKFSSLGITQDNEIIRVFVINTTTIREHYNITIDNIDLSIINFHRCWVNGTSIKVSTLVYHKLTFVYFCVNIIFHTLNHAIIGCTCIGIVGKRL